MKYTYKGKTYDVVKVNGKWRVYSFGPITIEEAMEVIRTLEKMDEESKETGKKEQ